MIDKERLAQKCSTWNIANINDKVKLFHVEQ